jgi:hypothetical protein
VRFINLGGQLIQVIEYYVLLYYLFIYYLFLVHCNVSCKVITGGSSISAQTPAGFMQAITVTLEESVLVQIRLQLILPLL